MARFCQLIRFCRGIPMPIGSARRLRSGRDAAQAPARFSGAARFSCAVQFLRMQCSAACTLMIAGILALACGSAFADTLLRVYAIRGFGGVVFSRGLNQLCDEVAKIPDVVCSVDEHYNELAIQAGAAAAVAAGQRLVLVGHSLGAHAALRIAAAMKGSVPLVVTIDPNWFPTPPLVPRNADIVLNYYQSFDVLGRATLKAAPAFRGQLRQFKRNEPHVGIERSGEVHAEIITHIRAILAGLKSPGPSAARPPAVGPKAQRPDAGRHRR